MTRSASPIQSTQATPVKVSFTAGSKRPEGNLDNLEDPKLGVLFDRAVTPEMDRAPLVTARAQGRRG
jgi:hypothetical protein